MSTRTLTHVLPAAGLVTLPEPNPCHSAPSSRSSMIPPLPSVGCGRHAHLARARILAEIEVVEADPVSRPDVAQAFATVRAVEYPRAVARRVKSAGEFSLAVPGSSPSV